MALMWGQLLAPAVPDLVALGSGFPSVPCWAISAPYQAREHLKRGSGAPTPGSCLAWGQPRFLREAPSGLVSGTLGDCRGIPTCLALLLVPSLAYWGTPWSHLPALA